MIPALAVAATALTGLLAGLNLGSVIAKRGARTLPGDVWARAHQAEDATFRRVMPPFVLATIALTIVAAVLGSGEGRLLYGAAALLVCVDLVVTVTGLVPLNRAIEHWSADAPPHWQQVRDNWGRLHAFRAAALIVAALLSTIALSGI